MFSTEIWPFLPKVNSPDGSELTLIQSMGTVGIVCGMQMEMIAFRRFIEYRKGISAGYVGQSKNLPQIIPTIAEEDFNSIKETSSLRRRQFFLTGPSWHVLKTGYTIGAFNKEFGAVSQADSTRV